MQSFGDSIRTVVAASVVMVLAACADTRIARDDIQFVAPAEGARIVGLREKFASLAGADGQLRLMVVNGMATDAHGYSFEIQSKIARELGQPYCLSDRVLTLDRPTFAMGPEGARAEEFPPATLRVTAWAASDAATPRFVVYEILWTPFADAVTDRFVARFETDVRYGANAAWVACASEQKRPDRAARRAQGRERPQRALLNELLKEEVVVGGLTDAVLSVGPLGAAARDAIRQGLCIMAADALEVPLRGADGIRCRLSPEMVRRFGGARAVADHLAGHEFAMLTYSLGSFLLIDALDEFRLWPDDLGDAEVTCELMPALLDDTPVYMFSNQVSLLVTAHPQFGCDPATTCDLYGVFGGRRVLLRDPRDRGAGDARPAACPARTRMQLVAFNDPNDVMGYRLPDYLAEAPLIGSVVNVRVHNPAFAIPGLFINPVDAHQNHDRHPGIRSIMIEGWEP
jgi:hypothetical protein